MTIGVPGVRIGHWTDTTGETGCTVVIRPTGTTASYEVRGGAPASRDLDALAPDKTVSSLDAILLTGGSAFGLAAADGVMRHLEETGRGVLTPGGRVPIVATLALFDPGTGDPNARPHRRERIRGGPYRHGGRGDQWPYRCRHGCPYRALAGPGIPPARRNRLCRKAIGASGGGGAVCGERVR
ncbi:P1 family peptidase [Nocardia sp. X0981]